MLFINSIIITVLPTPAPPNNPIFPPFEYGARRSITLIPVSKISVSVDWSVNFGASRCIGHFSFVFTSPFWSIGWPITFIILPKVSGPTGTLIGAPVFWTASPLFRPSVLSIAIVLTLFSPRCCATSKTSLFPELSTSNAVKISGNAPSNWTSTTAPITWMIFPFLLIL